MPNVLKNLSHWTSQPGTTVCDLRCSGRKQLVCSSEHSRCLSDTKQVEDRILPLPVCSCFNRNWKKIFFFLDSYSQMMGLIQPETSAYVQTGRSALAIIFNLLCFAGSSGLLGCPVIPVPWELGWEDCCSSMFSPAWLFIHSLVSHLLLH